MCLAPPEFLLGTHEPSWLHKVDVPLFLSAVRLRRYDWTSDLTMRRLARCRWALDSGGFSIVSTHGRWTISAAEYVAYVRAWTIVLGAPMWCAPQDYMCEPFIVAKTGLSVAEHQRRTIASVLELRELAPEVRWIPVLQGWAHADYMDHVRQYADAGIDLATEPTVGVGSICRRQGTHEAAEIIGAIADQGIRVHAFGVKRDGLRLFAHRIVSADSLAWSFVARRRPIRLPGCKHATCANCRRWALQWRERIVSELLTAVDKHAAHA